MPASAQQHPYEMLGYFWDKYCTFDKVENGQERKIQVISPLGNIFIPLIHQACVSTTMTLVANVANTHALSIVYMKHYLKLGGGTDTVFED